MINRYRVKICGITDEVNYSELKKYQIDYFGFIFYEKSPRYILNNPDHAFIKNIKNKVAVFVDENIDTVISILEKYNFSYVQLHGNESTKRCSYIRNKFDLPIIKAFGIKNKKDLESALFYEGVVDYFLFDAKQENAGGQKGGLNKVFDWKILQEWKGKEFFLAGGININNIKLAMMSTNAFCIDISSGVETMLGVKDTNMIKERYREFKTLE